MERFQMSAGLMFFNADTSLMDQDIENYISYLDEDYRDLEDLRADTIDYLIQPCR